MVAVTCLALSLLPSHAQSMVVVERDFPDLVHRAEIIVAGTVTEIRQTQKSSGAPYTLVTVDDLTMMKGAPRESITLEIYGGTVGEYAIKVPDMPSFTEGERVVLFIAGNGVNVCPLVGVWQGTFRLRIDPSTGEEIVVGNEGQLVGDVVGGKVLPLRRSDGGGASSAGMTLDEFRERVADELASPTRGTR